MPSGPWAEIVGKNGFRYRLTDADVLWAGRMADGEGDDDAAKVLWSMTQRLVLVRGSSFTRLIQAYSQPINPIWQRDGVCCRQGATGCPARPSESYYGTDYCSESRLRRRDAMFRKPWDELPAGVRRVVSDWATARLPDPVPRAVDFAAAALVQRKMASNSDIRVVSRGGNWFVSKPASRAWSGDDYVTMQLSGRVAGPSLGASAKSAAKTAVMVGGPVILVGAAAFAFWSYRQAR